MNKSDLINQVANNLSISKTEASKNIEAVIAAMKQSIQEGGGLTIVGFGSFNVIQRAQRKGRNPQTGKEIKIKSKHVVKFKVGKELKKSVDSL